MESSNNFSDYYTPFLDSDGNEVILFENEYSTVQVYQDLKTKEKVAVKILNATTLIKKKKILKEIEILKHL
jgi:hypothetical protein